MADIAYCLRFTVHCLRFTVYCSLFTACVSATPVPTATRRATATPTATATPAATPVPVRYALIGKARGLYWSNVERGAKATEIQLGLPSGSVVYSAPDQEDPAAQIIAVEEFIARKVRGIAIAPSDARALELSIKQARDAGIWVITFDSDAPNGQRLFFVGTPQRTVGREAASALLKLLGERGGKLALGSTLLDSAAMERINAFREALKNNNKLTVLDAANDKHDINLAAQLVKTTISANKDLIGAFGVYAYNHLVWCRALKEAGLNGKTALVGFELSNEAADCLKENPLSAVIAPRDYAQGLQSVLALDSLERKGLLSTAAEFNLNTRSARSEWVVDVGVDVISLDGKVGMSLAAYAKNLDELNIPHDWRP